MSVPVENTDALDPFKFTRSKWCISKLPNPNNVIVNSYVRESSVTFRLDDITVGYVDGNEVLFLLFHLQAKYILAGSVALLRISC